MAIYSENLSAQLRGTMERYDLATRETEVLTAWVSTVTGSLSLSSAQEMEIAKGGLEDLSTITDSEVVLDIAVMCVIQAIERVRYAVVLRKPGTSPRVAIYLGQPQKGFLAI